MKLSSIHLLLILLIACYSSANKVILISLDGFRYDYLDRAKKHGKNISAFEAIFREGFIAEVQNVFPTNTMPSHFSITTGRYPEIHGIVNNNFFDPYLNETFSMTSVEQALDTKWLPTKNAERIWQTVRRHGGRSCILNWPGSYSELRSDKFVKSFGLFGHFPSFRGRMNRLTESLSKDDVSFCAMYYPEPDEAGHKFGPESEEVLETIEQLNDGIAYLLQKIKENRKLDGKVNVIITSDHGMVKIPRKKIIPLYRVIRSTKYMAVSSGSMVGFWKARGGRHIMGLYRILKSAKINHTKLYLKSELPTRWHYSKNPRIAPLMLFADLGYLIKTEPFEFSKEDAGSHGFDNAYPQMHPFMVASGPKIKSIIGKQFFHQVDIYALICALLGLRKPNKIDGRIDRVVKFLKNSPSKNFMKDFTFHASGIKLKKSQHVELF